MKMMNPSQNSVLEKNLSILILGTGALLAATHLLLVARSGDESLIPLSVLFWSSTGFLLWQKRNTLITRTDIGSMLAGLAFLALFFTGGLYIPEEHYLAAAPFLGLLGLTIGCSGWRTLKQYQSELLLMFSFGIPKALLWSTLDLRETTAYVCTQILRVLQFDVVRDGIFIYLPTGGVEVIHDCSGLNGMLYLFAISILLLVMLPITGLKRYFIPVLGVAIAFVANAARVTLLTIMAADPDPAKFNYWHGTSVFSLGALCCFGGLYFLILWLDERSRKSAPSSNLMA